MKYMAKILEWEEKIGRFFGVDLYYYLKIEGLPPGYVLATSQ
jgi:hypothetical protein